MSRFSPLFTPLNNQENLQDSSKLFNLYVSKFKTKSLRKWKNYSVYYQNFLPTPWKRNFYFHIESNLFIVEDFNHNFKMKLIKKEVTNPKSNFFYGLSRENFYQSYKVNLIHHALRYKGDEARALALKNQRPYGDKIPTFRMQGDRWHSAVQP